MLVGNGSYLKEAHHTTPSDSTFLGVRSPTTGGNPDAGPGKRKATPPGRRAGSPLAIPIATGLACACTAVPISAQTPKRPLPAVTSRRLAVAVCDWSKQLVGGLMEIKLKHASLNGSRSLSPWK